jgi:hypothetical protein
MNYSLEEFCRDCRNALAQKAPINEQIEQIAEKLAVLLRNEAFVTTTFNESTQPGKRELYHDPDFGFYVLAHVQEGGKRGTPHSHGDSWAIYGNASAFTRMTEYERINADQAENVILKKTSSYDLGVGQTKAYGPGVIHATEHPEKAWVLRIVGAKLEEIPRYQYRKFRDQIVEAA